MCAAHHERLRLSSGAPRVPLMSYAHTSIISTNNFTTDVMQQRAASVAFHHSPFWAYDRAVHGLP